MRDVRSSCSPGRRGGLGLEFSVEGLGLEFSVEGLGFRFLGLEFQGLGFRV